MMLINKYLCDHCGKELNQMVDYTELKIDMTADVISIDLCNECYQKLVDIVDKYCSKYKEEGAE